MKMGKLGRIDIASLILFFALLGILTNFVAIPLINTFKETIFIGGEISFLYYDLFFKIPQYRQAFYYTLYTSLLTSILITIIGIPLAYILTRYDFWGRSTLAVLATMPLIMPPFISALSFLLLLNPVNGVINIALMKLLKLEHAPINIYWHVGFDINLLGLSIPIYIHPGIVLIQTLNLYPLIYITVAASLANIDPSLEESGMNLGAKGFKLFRTITFPLILPGYAAGLILAFIWSMSDLGTPFMLGFYPYLPLLAYLSLAGGIGVAPIAGLIICVLLLAISILSLAVIHKYVSLKQYAVVSIAKVAPKRIGGLKAFASLAYLITIISLSLLPHIGIFYGAFTTPGFGIFTLDNISYVLANDLHYFRNSLYFSSIATALSLVLGITIAYFLIRRKIPGRSFLDILSMLPFAIPGVVIGAAYLVMFLGLKVPGTAIPLIHSGAPLILAYIFRRMPYAVRTAYAALQQVHVDLEAAAMNLGANRLKTFISITLPLILRGVFAGAILTFINIITELSSTMFLYPPGEPPVTIGIVHIAQRGDWGEACALGALLIMIVGLGLYLTNKVFGRRMGAAFGA